MKHGIKRMALAALTAALCCGAASADDGNSRWYGAGMFGYVVPDRSVKDQPAGGVAGNDGVRDYKYGVNFQGVLGYDLFEAIALELNGFATQFDRRFDGRQDRHYGLGVDVNLGSPVAWQPFFLVGGGAAYEDYGLREVGGKAASGKYDVTPYANVGLGLYLPGFSATMPLRLEARWNAMFDDNDAVHDTVQDVRLNLGVMFGAGHATPKPASPVTVVPVDSDADGIPDASDACPGTPAGSAVDATGCPPKVGDADADGVPDDRDHCPNTPKTVSATPDGCTPDTDGDGIKDDLDKCPGTPAGVAVDANGCEPAKDSDGDGVTDDKDLCPATPAGTKVDAHGCPVVVDSDGDGVADDKDACPNTPANLQVDERGCVLVQKVTLSGVLFALNSDQLLPGADATLDSVAASLKQYPALKVEVAGHTDSTGPAAFNDNLSKNRAKTVRAYLVKHGVPADQLTSAGYGSSQPVGDNQTAEGRASNRRVEFRVLQK